MKRFMREDRGYALVLMLLFMPVFVGLSLIVIDLGRGNNAHSDLYAAADAVALAAAGELDGGPDAIDRALAAVTEVRNNVSFLGLADGEFSVTLGYDGTTTPFNIIFLTEIPADDAIPIDQSWVDTYGTADGSAAKYVYVAAQTIDLNPIFPVPISFSDNDVPVQAKAVAGRVSAACGITPLFICNPFEGGIGGVTDLQTAFGQGKMNGRLLKMHPQGSDTAGPGNFGFLRIGAPGNDVLREYFAYDDPTPECFRSDFVNTQPGGVSVQPGLNVRFDIWQAPFNNGVKGWGKYTAAKNVRKGYWDPAGSSTCAVQLYDGSKDVAGQPPPYSPFPENLIMDDPTSLPDGTGGTAGAFLGQGVWDLETYLNTNHGLTLEPPMIFNEDGTESANPDYNADMTYDSTVVAELEAIKLANFPDGVAAPGADMVSRYDVYLWEVETGREANQSIGVLAADGTTVLNAGESGNPQCSMSKIDQLPPSADPNRRVIQAAIVNCIAAEEAGVLNGASSPVPIEGYASIFLTHPMESGPNGTINAEVIDITGTGGLGTLDDYIRVEAVLVR